MSNESSQSVKINNFGVRLRQAFDGLNNAEIARKMGKSEPAVGNYIGGRVTLPVIMDVAKLTGCSVDWLLTGEGEKFVNEKKMVNLDETFRAVVREIVREEFAAREAKSKIGKKPVFGIGETQEKEKKENKAA